MNFEYHPNPNTSGHASHKQQEPRASVRSPARGIYDSYYNYYVGQGGLSLPVVVMRSSERPVWLLYFLEKNKEAKCAEGGGFVIIITVILGCSGNIIITLLPQIVLAS